MSRFSARGGLKLGLLCLVLAGILLAVGSALGVALPRSSFFLIHVASPPPPAASTRQLGTAAAVTVATGCGLAPPSVGGSSIAQTLRVGPLHRTFRLHVPVAYRPTVHTPLVLSFHGHGSNTMQIERYTHLSQLADLRGFLVAYPQGIVGPDGATGWNTGRTRDPAVDDLGFVEALLVHLTQTLCVDPQRIYATGFSNGGGMTAVLACEFADRIAAFAPVAGDYYAQTRPCRPARPTSLLEIHGTADTINPYVGSAQMRYASVAGWLEAWVARDGCTTQPVFIATSGTVTQLAWDHCRAGTRIVHYRLQGGVHLWPALQPQVTPSAQLSAAPGAASTIAASATFDATSTIWSFFARCALPAATTATAQPAQPAQ